MNCGLLRRMAYGNESGIAVVDIVQKTCVLSMGTPDLYGSADPYQRVPRSPKRGGQPGQPGQPPPFPPDVTNFGSREDDPRCRSPSADQVRVPRGGCFNMFSCT